MEDFRAIQFHHARDFSKKMNVTFEFIRQNFKSLGKAILFIAGPPILVASLFMGTFMGEFFTLIQSVSTNPEATDSLQTYVMSVSFWLQMILMMVFFLVSSVMSIATINNYILLYGEKQTNQIEVGEVWERVRSTFWMYFATMLLFAFLAIVVYIVMIIPVVLLAAVSPGLIILGIFLLFLAVFYVLFSLSLTFFVRAYEKSGFFEAIARSFKLVQGKWWSTFGLVFILYIVMICISYVFILPLYIFMGVSAFHNISADNAQEPSTSVEMITIIFTSLYYLAQMLLAALPNIGIAFQYFNLVELKEAKGLMNQIDTLGQPPATLPASEDQY